MSEKDIIQKGDVAKYQLIIDRDGFDPQQCEFKVTLSWGIVNRGVMTIEREQMFHDEEWNLFFLFNSTTMLGMVTAECEYYVIDTDVEGGMRKNVDRQLLCLVADNGCAKLPRCTCKHEGNVEYKRTMRSDANSLYAIVRVNGEQVRTADHDVLRVRKHDLS